MSSASCEKAWTVFRALRHDGRVGIYAVTISRQKHLTRIVRRLGHHPREIGRQRPPRRRYWQTGVMKVDQPRPTQPAASIATIARDGERAGKLIGELSEGDERRQPVGGVQVR